MAKSASQQEEAIIWEGHCPSTWCDLCDPESEGVDGKMPLSLEVILAKLEVTARRKFLVKLKFGAV